MYGLRKVIFTVKTQLTICNYLIANVVLFPSMDAEISYLTVKTQLTTPKYPIANVVLSAGMDA